MQISSRTRASLVAWMAGAPVVAPVVALASSPVIKRLRQMAQRFFEEIGGAEDCRTSARARAVENRSSQSRGTPGSICAPMRSGMHVERLHHCARRLAARHDELAHAALIKAAAQSTPTWLRPDAPPYRRRVRRCTALTSSGVAVA